MANNATIQKLEIVDKYQFEVIQVNCFYFEVIDVNI